MSIFRTPFTTALIFASILMLSSSPAQAANCGRPASGGVMPVAADALHILNASIGKRDCTLGTCDVNSDCKVTVVDALGTLVAAVGGGAGLNCDAECPAERRCEDAGAPICNGTCPVGFACSVEDDDDVSDDRVTICHVPPGNPRTAHTITVDASAVRAHLAHGDYLGDCDHESDGCKHGRGKCARSTIDGASNIERHDDRRGDSDSDSDRDVDSDADSDTDRSGDSDGDSDSDSDRDDADCFCMPILISTTTLPMSTTTTTMFEPSTTTTVMEPTTTTTTILAPPTTLPEPTTTTTTILAPTTTMPEPTTTTTTILEPPTTLPEPTTTTTTTTILEPTTTLPEATTTTTSTTSTTVDTPIDDADNDGLADSQDPCPDQARNACFGPAAVDRTAQLDVRVNANASPGTDECAGDRTDCNGEVWYADFGFNDFGGGHSECDLDGGEPGCVIAGLTAIFGCESEATEDVLQCEHFDRPAEPEMSYTFDLADGDYLVNLLFANTTEATTEVGSRTFDILVEGVTAYADFDQVDAAGGSGIAVVRSALVSVSDGDGLTVEFGHVVENPAIKAIEVRSAAVVVP